MLFRSSLVSVSAQGVRLLGQLPDAVLIALLSAPDRSQLPVVVEAALGAIRSFDLEIQGRAVRGTCSAGIAVVEPSEVLSVCVDRAVLACAAAQTAGVQGCQFHDESLLVEAYEKAHACYRQLTTALQEGRVGFAAQQAWDLHASDDFRCCYVELLARIQDAETGEAVWGNDYLSAIVAVGDAVAVDTALLPLALDRIRTMLARSHSPLCAELKHCTFALNVSVPLLLDTHFCDQLMAWTSAREIAPGRICLELFEFAVSPSLPALAAVLTRLDRKSTRLNSSHSQQSRMPSSA